MKKRVGHGEAGGRSGLEEMRVGRRLVRIDVTETSEPPIWDGMFP